MMSRRQVIIAFGAGVIAVPFVGYAQTKSKVFHIGYVGNSTLSTEVELVEGFRQGLRERGYTEGKDIVIHYVWAGGRADLLPSLVADLIALRVDVLVTAGTPAVLAAKQATASIPIVMAAQGDAVAAGIVPNLARPGGNVTGLSTLFPDVEGKRLELLREIVPKLSRLALLANPANPFSKVMLRSTQAAAKALTLKTQVFEVSTIDEFDNAFAAIAKARPDAMAVLADRPFLISNRARIIRFAADNRLPTMHPFLEFVEEGGLIYYGPNFADMFRRAGTYIDKILKGAKPGDLPIEQPTKFELAINMKAAKALNLTVPQSILLRADRVIE
jgi:putative tryptophan/tyrosine transport system substrate-binding protein